MTRAGCAIVPARRPRLRRAALPLVVVSVLVWAVPVAGQQAPPESSGPPASDDGTGIVVEGGTAVVEAPPGTDRAPLASDRYAAGARTVVLREAFQDTERTVADVLERVPGVTLTRSGDGLAPTRVRIRGSRPEQVLVLVDGVPLQHVTDDPAQARRTGGGGVDLASIPLERVEAIEVVRGPASSLYGPGAAAGVVLIRTRPAREHRLSVAGTAGTGGYREGDVQWARPVGEGALSVHLNHRRTAGDYVYYDPAAAAGTTTTAPDPCAEPLGDGLFRRGCNEKRVTTLRLGWDGPGRERWAAEAEWYARDGLGGVADPRPFGEHRRRRLRLTYADETLLGAAAEDTADERAAAEGTGEAAATGTPTRLGWQGALQHLRSRRTENATLPSAESGRFTDTQADAEAWAERWAGRHRLRLTLSGGRQVLDDRHFDAVRNRAAVAGAWSRHGDDGTLEASVRRERLSDLALETTWRAAASQAVAGGAGVKASAATGYRPPSLYELYDPGAPDEGTSAANPDLRPETSRARDGGLFWHWPQHAYAEALRFTQTVQDDIVAVADPANPNLFVFRNIGRTRSTGWEALLDLRLPAGLGLSATYTQVEALIVDNAAVDVRDEGNRVPGVPASTWQATLDWRRTGWHAFAKARGVGRRYVDTANTRYLRPYRLYDAGVTVPLGAVWSVGVEGRNLTAETYAEVENHPPPGRSVFLTVRWSPGGEPAADEPRASLGPPAGGTASERLPGP